MRYYQAMHQMRLGKKLRRNAWPEKAKNVYLNETGVRICFTKGVENKNWKATNSDVFATDWELFE